MSRTTCIFQIPVIPLHTSIKWSSKSNLNLKSTILILQLSQYIHFPKKIYTFYPISDQESRQCHSYEVIVYYVSFWLLIICKRIKKAGLFLGWDIETGRSTGSDYWAALCCLSENQNKWPQTTDPNRYHYPLIT